MGNMKVKKSKLIKEFLKLSKNHAGLKNRASNNFSRSTDVTKSRSVATKSYASTTQSSHDNKLDKFNKFMPKLNSRELNTLNISVANQFLSKKGKQFR
jgi:hypothetical protein